MAEDDEELRPCPACDSLGYSRCPCWPGDCICGEDDRNCEVCDGTGWLDPFDDDDTY